MAKSIVGWYNIHMLGYLMLLFIIVPIVELALLIKVGQHIGAFNTISIVIGTGIAGALLAKSEGLKTLRGIQHDLELGIMPSERLLDGLFIFTGGLLLLTPGLITDMVGFLLLIPYTRGLVREWAKEIFRNSIEKNNTSFFTSHRF